MRATTCRSGGRRRGGATRAGPTDGDVSSSHLGVFGRAAAPQFGCSPLLRVQERALVHSGGRGRCIRGRRACERRHRVRQRLTRARVHANYWRRDALNSATGGGVSRQYAVDKFFVDKLFSRCRRRASARRRTCTRRARCVRACAGRGANSAAVLSRLELVLERFDGGSRPPDRRRMKPVAARAVVRAGDTPPPAPSPPTAEAEFSGMMSASSAAIDGRPRWPHRAHGGSAAGAALGPAGARARRGARGYPPTSTWGYR